MDKWDLMMECAKEVEQPFSSNAVMSRLIDKKLGRRYSTFQVSHCLSVLVKKGELEYAADGRDRAKGSSFPRYVVKK